MATFTAAPNSSDLLLFFTNDPLTLTGSPVFSISLYNGATLLGTATQNQFFEGVFNAPGADLSIFGVSPQAFEAQVDFASINNGTINGKIITTVTGGSVSGFSLNDFILEDGKSCPLCFLPEGDITKTSLTLTQASPVPEPSALPAISVALAALLGVRRVARRFITAK